MWSVRQRHHTGENGGRVGASPTPEAQFLFRPSGLRAHPPPTDPGSPVIQHNRPVQRQPGVCDPGDRREPDGDLAEQGPPRGAGSERGAGVGPWLQAPEPEPALGPVGWPPHLRGQQPCGQEERDLTRGERLSVEG